MVATDASYGGITYRKPAHHGDHSLKFSQSFQYVLEERAGH